MEQIKLGKALKRKFYTYDSSNNLRDYDTPPGATGLLYREDADSGAAISISRLATGVYSAGFSILGVNGFVKDSIGELEIAARVSGILLKSPIWAGIVESSDIDDVPTIGGVATGVWGYAGIRSLTDKVGFGVTGIPVLADVVTGIWGAPSRSLTDKVGFGVTGLPVLADVVTGIWGAPSRTLTDKTGFGVTGLPNLADIATGVWGFTGIRSLHNDNITRLINNKQVWEYVGGVYTGTIYLRNDNDTANILKTIARDPTTLTIITDPNYIGPMNFDAWSTP